MQKRFGLLIGIFLGLLISSFLYQKNQATAQPKSVKKVGFVNLTKIIRQYRKSAVLDEKVKRKYRSELAQIKALDEESKQLREEIPLYRPGSEMRQKKEKELAGKLFDIKFRKDRAEYFRIEERKANLEAIYQDISKEVRSHAEKHDFFMIMKVEDADFFGTRNPNELLMKINLRDVLYWDEEKDITDIIIKKMNNRWKRNRRK